MNSSLEHLGIFAEISTALVGFVAIFLAFVRLEERFSPEDGLRTRVIILSGFTGIFMSLTPIIIAENGLEEDLVWHLSSILFLGVLLLIEVFVAVRHFQLPLDSRRNIPLWNLVLAWSFALAATLLLAINVAPTNWIEASFGYTAAILLVLSAGATNFFTIALQKLL